MAEKQSKEMQAKESKAVQNEETKELLVKVTRESFGEKDGVKLYSYHINSIIRGKEKQISLVPKDNGGYELISIIFSDLDTVDGLIILGEFKPENGDTIKTFMVEIFVEENGIRYAYQLKPQRDSDKATLQILAQILKAKQSNN
ncbi:MAG: hypothetical protein J6A95_01810 [Clostridia bacterium]|nr:hypothetical protein [Clostridia bacterium]